jgi:hypothetical protein
MRLSSGAATSDLPGGLKSSKTAGREHVAAAEDGRAPQFEDTLSEIRKW